MAGEIGLFSLVLALLAALVQATAPLYGAATNNAPLMGLAGSAARAQCLFIVIAFATLTYCFVTSDFSLEVVAANSHSDKPLIYKIAGVWGNHEGSMLLWVLILALFGLAVALFGTNLPTSLAARVLAVQGMIGVGFLAFVLFTSNPFARLDPAPADGNGLNPLLQDPGLASHPPFLYLGYVGFSMAFSFAVAALIEGKVDPAWARWVRPWTLLAWCFLTMGIMLGSLWAYYELGWGGWWFWDPVENASLMPWLAGTALVHSAIVVEKRDALKRWTILLAILTFSLSLVGTFLVRSGVITSVHAFATDPARGIFILAILLATTGGALALYAIRAPSLKLGNLFAPVSRETSLVLNNVFLVSITGVVFVGTFYPLFISTTSDDRISVGPPFYNLFFVPMMIVLMALMGLGPLLSWKRGDVSEALARTRVAGVAALGVTIATAWLSWGRGSFAAAALGAAVWLFLSSATVVARRFDLRSGSFATAWRRVAGLPRSVFGVVVAHIGIAIVAAGIATVSTWQSETITQLDVGESARVARYEARLLSVKKANGPNYETIIGTFVISANSKQLDTMTAERRFYPFPGSETTEAAIRVRPLDVLYVALGEQASTRVDRAHVPSSVGGVDLDRLRDHGDWRFAVADRRLRIGAPRRSAPTAAFAAAE